MTDDEQTHTGSGRTDLSTAAQASTATLEPVESRRLVVIEGPNAGAVWDLDPLAPTRALLGTSAACGMQLTDRAVSRRHAAFEPAGARWKVTDLGSKNGTVVDGTGIIEAYVRGGEIIRVGGTALRVERAAAAASPPLTNALRFGRLVGASVAMRKLYPLCERLAKIDIPLVIEGETGTGKEVLAEALHEASGSTGPFVVFDCTTVAPTLVEAELFGHERGAFTGADQSRAGVFEEADGGTLLIDEIGDLDLALQAKLLRVLDRGELRRVGGGRPIRVNVRVMSATRRDLDRAVTAGQFRDDLFHRLAVTRIELPPLRDRHGDVGLLARHFASAMSAPPGCLTPEVLAKLDDHRWPGNVRELKNTVARLVALGDEDLADALDVPSEERRRATGEDWLQGLVERGLPFPIARRRTLDEFERRYVEHVLESQGGNVSRAAKASGLALRYFRAVKARRRGG